MNYDAHKTSHIANGAKIGDGSRIGAYCFIEENTRLGIQCKLGNYVRIGKGVDVGRKVVIHDHVSLFKGIKVEDQVFIGPSTVFTNILNPRAEQDPNQVAFESTLIKKGCTTGANSTILSGVTLGEYAFIAAGAVVLKDVKDYELMAGVPAKRKGWMSRRGGHLYFGVEGTAKCPVSGELYELEDGKVRLLPDQKS